MKKACGPNWFIHFVLLVGAGLLLLITCSCVALPDDRPWTYADLRAFGSLDAPSPFTDILAVYTRATSLTVDIRVDLLDINFGDKFTLRLTLWDDRNFSQTPLVVEVASTGRVQSGGSRTGQPVILPRVLFDPGLDTITIYLNRTFISDRYRLDISTYTSNPFALADEIQNIHSDAQPPLPRAPLLVAFWNTFPVTTPAQALRRWDGAHTGPLGGRHGLINILNGVNHSGVPVALLDVKNPASLAALNFMGNVLELQDFYARGLLILPDVAFGEPSTLALGLSRRAAASFGLTASQFVYSTSANTSRQPSITQPAPDPLPGYNAQFLPLADSTHLAISAGSRLIPLPSANAVEATADGLSLEVRRALVRTALSPDPADLVVLGGSLPQSTWGDVDMAGPTFDWIAAHPWIQMLGGQDLLTFPARNQPAGPVTAQTNHPWLQVLQSAPQNPITKSAWQTYLTLTAGTSDLNVQSLRNAYLGQIGELLAAADWAENRLPRIDCKDDLNGDGKLECILANRDYFAVIELAGARLTQLFYFDTNGPHQLVGPSSQFAVGLSDPSEWHPEKGEAADPSVIPGAFTDTTSTWTVYTPVIIADGITFINASGTQSKTYQITENSVQVRYETQAHVSTRIPLALDPQAFYSGPTEYRPTLGPNSWGWSLAGGLSVEVRTNAALSVVGFTSAIPFLALQEDPNLDYPPGNYLPFPLSLVTIQSDGNFSVQIIPK